MGEFKMKTILAIETSCDETAVALVRDGKELLSNVVSSQVEIHRRFGGVVPEVASRRHVEQMTFLLEEALQQAQIKAEEVDAVAVTQGPGLVGALLIGVTAAKTLAYSLGVPVIPVHHVAGHIYANQLVGEMQFPLVSLVVSGGHTELILMEDHYDFERLGQTRDDAAGEAYDKVARLLELSYPGGPVIDQLAQKGKVTYNFPRAWLEPGSLDFSFSGLKTAVKNAIQSEQEVVVEDVAASFQTAVLDVLVEKTRRAVEQTGVRQLIVAGGVSANTELRRRLQSYARETGVTLSLPPLELCTDNAAMIAAAAYYAEQKGIKAGLDLNADPSLPLE
ncbi:tRNA (adenosine(37)-N6)-threonylcarbamoyltransferase complex transferase subunit TsaD [Novibacillus thermophilus]|uniref:tRNA N6-adenosine threonylcarbamoyltransferase n=2 Tax=Novibacillus thermophilus TaxID=1471761 RepID=A0A1U9K3S6_9BACL|nr:tRNA (adenosine(37)-N6)-threonylcarbamoyltransferase complex transferase subunit TsaD [Novibacillus thermophilus]